MPALSGQATAQQMAFQYPASPPSRAPPAAKTAIIVPGGSAARSGVNVLVSTRLVDVGKGEVISSDALEVKMEITRRTTLSSNPIVEACR